MFNLEGISRAPRLTKWNPRDQKGKQHQIQALQGHVALLGDAVCPKAKRTLGSSKTLEIISVPRNYLLLCNFGKFSFLNYKTETHSFIYSFVQQTFIKNLSRARHCSGHWGCESEQN